jgi:hypothetical protein
MQPRRGERTRDDNAEELSDRYEGVNAGLSDVPALADAAAKPHFDGAGAGGAGEAIDGRPRRQRLKFPCDGCPDGIGSNSIRASKARRSLRKG